MEIYKRKFICTSPLVIKEVELIKFVGCWRVSMDSNKPHGSGMLSSPPLWLGMVSHKARQITTSSLCNLIVPLLPCLFMSMISLLQATFSLPSLLLKLSYMLSFRLKIWAPCGISWYWDLSGLHLAFTRVNANMLWTFGLTRVLLIPNLLDCLWSKTLTWAKLMVLFYWPYGL